MDQKISNPADKPSTGKLVGATISVIIGWAISAIAAFFVGMPVALASGMKEGGWNIHLVAPMMLSGGVAAVIYLPIYGVVRSCSKNFGAALICAIAFSIFLGMIAAFLMGRSV